jgi:hypothetical protein
MPCHVLQPSRLQMRLEKRKSLKVPMLCVYHYAVVRLVCTEWFPLFSSVGLFEALRELRAKPTHPTQAVGQHILDVRGQRPMVAFEFASPSHPTFDPAVKKDTPPNLAAKGAEAVPCLFLLMASV